ncbi:AraC family transcriptional regulator [Paenibacillus sp. KN14-4R]|uniref:AraC family transcriptional regulator n=1 Tax=Paenibacillus sp. KN14-4R TaxID=3445773 RepID=UPI003FA0D41D
MVKEEYIIRMNKVINYIQHHLDQDLSLHKLAEQAAFSPFHFHRVFKQVMGVSVNEFVRREKIERAAKMLLHNPSAALTSVALDCGFSSVSTFSRAFKERFGVNATQYREQYLKRRNSKICKVDSKNGKAEFLAGSYDSRTAAAAETTIQRGYEAMNVEVRDLSNLHVAYVRVYEGYEPGELSSAIDQSFNKVCGWVEARNLFTPDTKVMGVFYDDSIVTSSSNRRYDAAVTIPDTIQAGSDGVDTQVIPASQYAVCRIEESSMGSAIAKMDDAFGYMKNDWLPSSAYQLVDQPLIEIYVSGPNAPTIVIEALVPIAPK